MKACYIPHPMFPGRMPNGVPSFDQMERDSLRRELQIQRMNNDFLRREVEMLRRQLGQEVNPMMPHVTEGPYSRSGKL